MENNLLDLDATTKASVLLEALPYIQRFKDSIFVIKYGGAFMDSRTSVNAKIASDIASYIPLLSGRHHLRRR